MVPPWSSRGYRPDRRPEGKSARRLLDPSLDCLHVCPGLPVGHAGLAGPGQDWREEAARRDPRRSDAVRAPMRATRSQPRLIAGGTGCWWQRCLAKLSTAEWLTGGGDNPTAPAW